MPPLVLIYWALFALGAIPANLAWLRAVREIRERGIDVPYLGWTAHRAAWHLLRIVRHETDPVQRQWLKRLAWTFYLSSAWCIVWFVCFAHHAITARPR